MCQEHRHANKSTRVVIVSLLLADVYILVMATTARQFDHFNGFNPSNNAVMSAA